MAPSFGFHIGSYPSLGMPSAETLLELPDQVESLGYDSFWVGDHVLWHSEIIEPVTTLAAAAARTQRIRLGTGILLVSLRNAVIVARTAAALDYLSGGRLILGVGVGGENPAEFEACGVPLAERGARANEALQVIRLLLTERPASFEGRYYRFRDVLLLPGPVQQPHPPIWVGGRTDAALRRVIAHGSGWMGYFHSPSGLARIVARLRQLAQEAGRPLGPDFTIAQPLYTYVSPDGDTGPLVRYVTRAYGPDFVRHVPRVCLTGTPAECRRRLEAYREAGVNCFLFTPACAPEELAEQARRIAELAALLR
ncbi:MAG: TIGR03619 family F420-dependent LLM class oxidoreductase [Clostridia bacterium]|nr:TIGR03619 family F420-dependent LLM class oxidoreductase [Clostridia bacterium]